MKGVYARANKELAANRIAVLNGLQKEPLEKKVEISKQIIETALKIGRPALLYSGGKDSTVLLDLLQDTPGLLAIHNNTTLGDPAKVHWIRRFLETRYPGVEYRETIADDPVTMWQTRGHFPILSKRGFTAYKHRDPGLKISPVQCCYQLKEKYANTIMGAEEIAVAFWGNRASESMRRRMTFIDNGFLFKPKKYAWWQAYPIQHWTQGDVDSYINRRVPELKEGASFEDGCLCCGTDLTFWPNNLGRLYQKDRARWEFFMRAGFAEQIMRIKGIPGSPEEVITEKPEALLHIEPKKCQGRGF